ncbi:membrane protein [Photobacterium leiognathi subsp. mandapamensis]|nr:membrane protein [Photobacterium leiognathi subsp. mandapamensis]
MTYSELKQRKADNLQKTFLWLIIIDYILLSLFLYQLSSLDLKTGTMISLLLVLYNGLLAVFCFHRANRTDDGYIIYPIISAILLAFICFLYFFFLVA